MCSEPCLVHWWRCVNFVHAETLHMAVFVQSTFLTLTVHAGIPHKCMFLSAFYYLLLSCILATKPVRGICGVSWTTGGGGGGATDTGATTIRQQERPRDREQRRCLDRKKDRRHRKKSKRASQRRENPNWASYKRKRGGETTKSLWASKNSTESIAEQLVWKVPISVLLCCVFQAGPNRPSSNLSLRIYLISICFKNQTQKLQLAIGFRRGERTAKHDADPETWQLQLQDKASGRQIRLLKEFAGMLTRAVSLDAVQHFGSPTPFT